MVARAAARAGDRLERMGPARMAVAPQVGDPLGRISIPRVGVDEVIVEGDDDLTLSFAAGHVPGTAVPGAIGNAVLAGHRDGVFAALARVRAGDAIVIVAPGARSRDGVRSAEVVRPDATSVLAPTTRASLTLVTCYPFRYVGPAPFRYVVRADLVAAAPAPPAAGGPGREGPRA